MRVQGLGGLGTRVWGLDIFTRSLCCSSSVKFIGHMDPELYNIRLHMPTSPLKEPSYWVHGPLGKANAKAAQALFEDDGLIIAAFLTSTWASEDSAFRILRVQGLGFRVGGFGGLSLRMQGLRALSGRRV